MAFENIKTQDDFNALGWEDKLRYAAENPTSSITNQEKQRVKGILFSNPGYGEGADWYNKFNAASSGAGYDNVMGGNYNKKAYTYNPSDTVAVRQYVNSSTSPYAPSLDWDGNNVLIGGKSVQPDFVQDGKAYVNKDTLQNLLNGLNQENGVQSNQGIVQKQDAKYGGTYDDLLDRLVNRKEFNYDPQSDQIFQVYKDQYTAQGDKAMRDAVGNYAGLTGGYANSAAVTAGAQANQGWQDKLMAVVPELAQQAYGRYMDNFNMDRSALSDVMGVDNMQFDRAYNANRDNIGDIRYNNEAAEEQKRYYDNRDYERSKYEDETAYNHAQYQKEYDRKVKLEDMQLALERAQQRGSWTAEEAALWGVPQDSDPHAGDLAYQKGQNQVELQRIEEVLKKEKKYR